MYGLGRESWWPYGSPPIVWLQRCCIANRRIVLCKASGRGIKTVLWLLIEIALQMNWLFAFNLLLPRGLHDAFFSMYILAKPHNYTSNVVEVKKKFVEINNNIIWNNKVYYLFFYLLYPTRILIIILYDEILLHFFTTTTSCKKDRNELYLELYLRRGTCPYPFFLHVIQHIHLLILNLINICEYKMRHISYLQPHSLVYKII